MFEQEKKAHLLPLQQFLENPLSWIIPEFININITSRDNQLCWSLTKIVTEKKTFALLLQVISVGITTFDIQTASRLLI